MSILGFQKPYLPVYIKLLCQHNDITQEMMNHFAKKLVTKLFTGENTAQFHFNMSGNGTKLIAVS